MPDSHHLEDSESGCRQDKEDKVTGYDPPLSYLAARRGAQGARLEACCRVTKSHITQRATPARPDATVYKVGTSFQLSPKVTFSITLLHYGNHLVCIFSLSSPASNRIVAQYSSTSRCHQTPTRNCLLTSLHCSCSSYDKLSAG